MKFGMIGTLTEKGRPFKKIGAVQNFCAPVQLELQPDRICRVFQRKARIKMDPFEPGSKLLVLGMVIQPLIGILIMGI